MNYFLSVKIVRECILTLKYCSIPARTIKSVLADYIEKNTQDLEAKELYDFMQRDSVKYYYCEHSLAETLNTELNAYQAHKLYANLLLRIVSAEVPYTEVEYAYKEHEWKPALGVMSIDIQSCDVYTYKDLKAYSLPYMSIRELDTMIIGRYMYYHVQEKTPERVKQTCDKLNSISDYSNLPTVTKHSWIECAKLYQSQLYPISRERLLRRLFKAILDTQNSGTLAGVELRTRLQFVKRFVESDHASTFYFDTKSINQHSWRDFLKHLCVRVYTFSVIDYRLSYKIKTSEWIVKPAGTYTQIIHGISVLQYFEQKIRCTSDQNILRSIAYTNQVKYRGDLCRLCSECRELNQKPKYFICPTCGLLFSGTAVGGICPICKFKNEGGQKL